MTIKSFFCKLFKTKSVTNEQVVIVVSLPMIVIFTIFSIIYTFLPSVHLLIPINNNIIISVICIFDLFGIAIVFFGSVILVIQIIDKILMWLEKPAFECDLKKE